MKIAVWHNLPSGGGKRALYDQVRGLVARGHQIEAWCPPTADRSYLPLGEIVPEHVVSLEAERHWTADPSTRSLLQRVRWNSLSKLQAIERHCRSCAQEINSKPFDVLFSACCTLFRTPPIAKFVDIPGVLYLQEPNRFLYEAQPELPWVAISWRGRDLLDVRFWRRALTRAARLAVVRVWAREERKNALAFEQILVNSHYSRESVLRSLGIDSTVCYLGVDTQKFPNWNLKRESFALSIGAVVPAKNIEFLIESLGKVATAYRPRLVLIANMIDGDYLQKLHELASRISVDFEVKYRISDDEIANLLNRARMMLYAPRLEPFGYAPLEAGACGLPVVAVAEGGVRETIQQGVNGILVEHESESMAAAIERLVLNDQLHMRLSEGAQDLVTAIWSLAPSIDRLELNLLRVLRKVSRVSETSSVNPGSEDPRIPAGILR